MLSILKRLLKQPTILEMEEAGNVPRLAKVLRKDMDPVRRRYAAESLETLGDSRAVRPLIEALQDHHASVRRSSARALQSIRDTSATEALIRTLEGDADWRVRREAARTLGELGDTRSIEPLINRLDDTDGFHELRDEVESSPTPKAGEGEGWLFGPPSIESELARDPLVWMCCAAALKSIGLPARVALISCLSTDRLSTLNDVAKLARAAGVLRAIDPAGAVQPLVSLLKHEEPLRRGMAAEALGELADKSALKPLLALLEEELRVQSLATVPTIEALIELDDIRTAPLLIKALRRSTPRSTLRKITTELTRFGESVIEPLLDELEGGGPPAAERQREDEEFRAFVVEVLSEVANENAVEPLLVRLASPSADVRQTTAELLGSIGDIRAVDPLILQLEHPKPRVRRSAAEALGKLGDARVLPALTSLLGDSKHTVRESAKKAIARMEDTPS